MEMIAPDQIMTFISNQGFAIGVAVYSLTRLEKTMQTMTAVLQRVETKLDLGGK